MTGHGETLMLDLCSDCASMVANGELGYGDENAEAAHYRAMKAQGWWPQYVLVVTGEGADFSNSWCDGCGASDGGSRTEGAAIPVRQPAPATAERAA